MGRKTEFIAGSNLSQHRVLRETLKPYVLSLPSKKENRCGNSVFCFTLTLMPSLGTIYGTTPSYVIAEDGQRLVPLLLMDIRKEDKNLVKANINELIDRLFEAYEKQD